MIDYLFVLAAYLMGSISSAIIVSRVFGLQDPRKVGSGNPGATNVLRHSGKKAAVITLAGDVLKGALPVWVARIYGVDPMILAGVMLAGFLGHVFPVFHGFRGGKGVATAFGALAALNGWIGVALLVIWLLTAFTFRYASVAGVVGALVAPLLVGWLQGGTFFIASALVMTGLMVWRHRSNVRNLLAGTEGKIGY